MQRQAVFLNCLCSIIGIAERKNTKRPHKRSCSVFRYRLEVVRMKDISMYAMIWFLLTLWLYQYIIPIILIGAIVMIILAFLA